MAESIRKKKSQEDNKSIRTGLSEESIRLAFLDNLFYVQGRFLEVASANDKYKALAYTVRDRLLHRWVATVQTYQRDNPRTVCYLSAEYLPGPFMGNNLLNLGIHEQARQATAEGRVVDIEHDRKYLPRDLVGDAKHRVVVGRGFEPHLVMQHRARVVAHVHRGVHRKQEEADPVHVATAKQVRIGAHDISYLMRQCF